MRRVEIDLRLHWSFVDLREEPCNGLLRRLAVNVQGIKPLPGSFQVEVESVASDGQRLLPLKPLEEKHQPKVLFKFPAEERAPLQVGVDTA